MVVVTEHPRPIIVSHWSHYMGPTPYVQSHVVVRADMVPGGLLVLDPNSFGMMDGIGYCVHWTNKYTTGIRMEMVLAGGCCGHT